MYDAPGLTLSQFLDCLSDGDVRRLIDVELLSMLDATFGGSIAGDHLRRAARTTISLDEVLRDEAKRELVLQLLPDGKRAELELRSGRGVHLADRREWTDAEVQRLREFFGLVEDVTEARSIPSTAIVKPNYGLFGHQRAAVRILRSVLDHDERRAVLHLPTGVGKTRIAMHVVTDVLRDREPSVIVWLASGKELLEQAVSAFDEAWRHLGTRRLQVGSMWGDSEPDLDRFSDGFLAVGLAKAWAMLSQVDSNWATRLSSRVRLVVFDEAHQSIARTYRRITDDLTLDYRCALLGLTATPGRTWADIDADGELAEFFSGNKVTLEVPGDNPIDFLIENGYLARPIFRTLFSQPGLAIDDGELARISSSLDIPARIVAALSMSEQYVTAVLGAIEELLDRDHRRVLVFAATVAHARVLTAVLVARGVRSEAVTGLTPTRVRDRAIRAFRSDDEVPMVIVNFGVLTTGFDAPKASAAVIARPTKSLVLYSQMVGRVIRGPKAGGTDSCEIVTVVDPSLPGFGDVAAAFLNWEDVW